MGAIPPANPFYKMQFNDDINVLSRCPKCKDEVIKAQRFIVRCEDCKCEMDRIEIVKSNS